MKLTIKVLFDIWFLIIALAMYWFATVKILSSEVRISAVVGGTASLAALALDLQYSYLVEYKYKGRRLMSKLSWKVWAIILAVIFTVGIGIAIAVAVWPEDQKKESLTSEQYHAIAIHEYSQFLMNYEGEDQVVDILRYFDLDITPYCEWDFDPFPSMNGVGGYDRWYIQCQLNGKVWRTVTDFRHPDQYDDGRGLNAPDTQRLVEFLITEGFVKRTGNSKVQHFAQGFEEINRNFVRCADNCIILQSRFDNCWVQQIILTEDIPSYLVYVPNVDSYVGDSIALDQCGNDEFTINVWTVYDGNEQRDLIEKAQ